MPVPQTRTRWAEEQSEELLAIPFISEFVFRSPQVLDKTQREVADLLIFHKGKGLLVSQKAQEDPENRDERKNELWVFKYAKAALCQLVGALYSGHKNIWCIHPRRGRVDFPDGLPPIAHGVVIVETFRPVDLPDTDLPPYCDGIPITYMSINDFLNVASQLRTVPELLDYLDARRELPASALRRVGDELVLFEHYLLSGTLRLLGGHKEAAQTLEGHSSELNALHERMAEYRYFSSLLEHVADALATRSPTCLDGLPNELIEKFDSDTARQNYILMQEILADLSLRERAELGRQFDAVLRSLAGRSQGYTQAAAYVDSKPDWVFVFGSSKGWERAGMFNTIERTMRAAQSFYKKQRCIVVIDRDGEGYEVAVTRPDVEFVPMEGDVKNGEKLFGSLRTVSRALEGFGNEVC